MTIHINKLTAFLAGVACMLPGCESTSTTPSGVASVEVRPTTSMLVVGQSVQLQAVLEDAAGNLLSGRPVSWTSSAQSVATVDPSGLVSATGRGNAVITATSEGVRGDAAVAVRTQSVIELDRDVVAFVATRGEDDPGTQQVNIGNGGESSLVNLVTSVTHLDGSSGWLAPSLSSTTAPSVLTLDASVRDLATGTYAARVDVSSGTASNSPQSVQVTFTVLEPAPVIGLTPDNVEWDIVEDAPEPTASFAVVNAGGGELDGLELMVEHGSGEPTGWLEVSLRQTVAPTQVDLVARYGGLQPGTYSATVWVDSPAVAHAPVAFSVTFTLRERAAFVGPGSAGPGDPDAR